MTDSLNPFDAGEAKIVTFFPIEFIVFFYFPVFRGKI